MSIITILNFYGLKASINDKKLVFLFLNLAVSPDGWVQKGPQYCVISRKLKNCFIVFEIQLNQCFWEEEQVT